MKRLIPLIIIILLAGYLRFYALTDIPSGFYSDESLYGYEAFSILKTGRDQFGNFLPLAFKGFGDFRPPLYIYATVPFIALFGLNEYAVRLPSAFFSLLTVYFVYLLAKELFKSEAVALLSSLFFSVSPWSLHLARMAHDTNLTTFLITVSIWLFLKGIRENSLLHLSIFFFLLSLYGYYSARVVIPLIAVSLIMLHRREILSKRRNFAFLALIAMVMIIPLYLILKDPQMGWSRVSFVNIWSDPGWRYEIEEYRGEDLGSSSVLGRVFHNKLLGGSLEFFKNYLSHFEPNFLLFGGGSNNLYKVPDNGILLWFEPFFLIFGFYCLLKEHSPENKNYKALPLLASWFIFALIPDSLTKFAPSAPRIQLALPVVSVVEAAGAFKMGCYLVNIKSWIRLTILVLVGFLCTFNCLYFFHFYFIHFPLRFNSDWHYGLSEVVKEASEQEKKVDKIWVSKKVWGWVNFLFFLKYPPEKFQKEAVLLDINEYGLGWVYRFGKYYFDDFPLKYDFSKNVLYIGEPSEFNPHAIPEKIIYYPNHKPAYYFVSTEEIKRVCPKCGLK
jgi:4-amino-4-deoxy-L-arabinose transferase-like glycosyltransferase